MLKSGKMERGVFEIVDTESLVPANHLLRKIDAAVDFGKIYDMVEPLYCADNGRPSVDPVVLFKMVLIQHLYPLRYKSSVVSNRLILPLPSLKGWMHRKSWINTGIAMKDSNSMLPITLLYSSQIRSSASGVSKGARGVKRISV